MLPTFPILLSVFSSLWGVSSPSPVPETTLNSNVVAPAATPPPWKDEVIAHVPIHNILDPAVSTPPNMFAVHPTISGTDTPTNYPTKITSIATSTESYEGTDLNPLGGEGYSIWTHITAKTRYTVEQWPARVTSVPYHVQRSVEETIRLTVFITQYLTGYPPRSFITGGTVTDPPYTSYTMLSTATSTLNENPRVLEFSLTSFPTSITKTYTSTSILTIQGVHTTKVVVDTITQSWSAQPTSFPYTLNQRAIARTWRANNSIPFGLRTSEPKFIVGPIPTSLAASEQASPDKTQNNNHNLKAPLGKRYNSIYPLAFAFTTLPTNLPTTMTASSTSDITTSYTFIQINAFAGAFNYSVDITAHLTETWYEAHPSAPTSFPYSVTGSIVGTTLSSNTVYQFAWTQPPPYPCNLPTPATWCPTVLPGTPGIPTKVDAYTSRETNTWTWTKVYHFSFTGEKNFPTTVTRVYTSTSWIEEVSQSSIWDFGGGPRHATASETCTHTGSSTEALSTLTPTPRRLPLPPLTLPTGDLTTITEPEPELEAESGNYNVTYIDISTIIETWESKPTSFPTTITHTGNVTHLSAMTFSPGGLSVTGVYVERIFPTMVVGSIKEGLERNGSSGLSWEILPFL